ncbi:SGNH/GDSL hydrolase family protein [Actinocatenispora rupis]|uniref:Lipase n=1 Tax=Actinocatenispora rupis TaxID=519421 RepID=A0A8J3IXC5_9ACTN|nr:lipase [Actinocatenispora rupis]
MSRASRARRIAVAAAYGGGGLGLLGAAATGVLIGEAKLARWAIRIPEDPVPECDGDYGTEYEGAPLTMAVLGDSSAAGMGAELPRQTPGALLASGLADILHRPVRLHCFAVVGALSADLHPQLDQALDVRPDVAVVLVGGNDVTHMTRPPVAVRHLSRVVERLRGAGAQVVVGTCPDLGTIRPIRQPLRWICRRWSRELAAAQTIGAVQAGARTVSLGDLLGPDFLAAPDEMFSADHFHPSPAGYAKAVAAILPTVASVVGGLGEPVGPEPVRMLHSLPEAAVAAADRAGTEVSAASEAPVGGRWAQLRRRVRLLAARPTDPRKPATMVSEPAAEQT